MPSKAKKLCLIGSTDTKGNLLSYLRKKARARGIQARIIDSRLHGGGRSGKDGAMLKAAGRVKEKILRAGPGCAFLAIGGGTGSWIALQAMSALPQGVPKALVTTLAFDPRPYVAGTDIVLVPCPVDLQGTNQFLEAALDNGLDAVLGLHDRVDDSTSHVPMIAITALGVVQPCVDGVMEELERIGHRTCVFHAAGSNGATLAKWILGNKTIKAVVDLAPNDLHPLIGNGTGDGHAANRLAFAARTKTPYLLVPGGLDFLSRPTGRLSAGERRRASYVHSPAFTHVRTSRSEVHKAASFVAAMLRKKRTVARIMVPTKGWSAANRAKGPLHAPKIDGAFARQLARSGMPKEKIEILSLHVNDKRFARAVAKTMDKMLAGKKT